MFAAAYLNSSGPETASIRTYAFQRDPMEMQKCRDAQLKPALVLNIRLDNFSDLIKICRSAFLASTAAFSSTSEINSASSAWLCRV
jgi:hypothetical protein